MEILGKTMSLLADSPIPDLITVGRSGVDIYPNQINVGLEDVESFTKFLGGAAANVAVAAARLGVNTAVITGVGDDAFGRFISRRISELGVDNRYVKRIIGSTTPLTFCEIYPPDTFPLFFYRSQITPYQQLEISDIPNEAIENCKVLWLTMSGFSQEPSRSTHQRLLEIRNRRASTILDLDYRKVFWKNPNAYRKYVSKTLPSVNIAIGNQEECELAIAQSDPEKAADTLLDFGLDIAIVKCGAKGTLCKTPNQKIVVSGSYIKVLNGLGAGDAFGGSFCHGLLANLPLPLIIQRASNAGAIVASRLGCAGAMPTETEILASIARNPQTAAKIFEHSNFIDSKEEK